jgi:hypothetical protein
VGRVVIDTTPTDIFPQIRFYDGTNTNYGFLLAANANGCTASIALSTGTYQPGATLLANRITMDGLGMHMQVIDATTGHGNVTMGGDVHVTDNSAVASVLTSGVGDGGVMGLYNTQAVFGLFPNGATHGGQLVFNYDSTNSDAKWELDGYLPNWNSAFTQFGIITGDVSGLGAGSGGASITFGVTTYSTMIPVVSYSCGTIGQIGGNVNALTASGFSYTLGGTSPASWSIIFWGWRVR